MEILEARIEAERRWTTKRPQTDLDSVPANKETGMAWSHSGICFVGYLAENRFFQVIKGEGPTYEDAFADADRRAINPPPWLIPEGAPLPALPAAE